MDHLKAKLAQLPAGTHLSSVTTRLEHEQHKTEFREIEDAATAAGLVLEIEIPR